MNLMNIFARPRNAPKMPTGIQPMNYTVLSDENSSEGELLIYGYIGWDWWSEGEGPNTAEALATLIAEMSKKKKAMHIRINSLGGDVYEGSGIVTAIRAAVKNGCEVHTYNDGSAMSMAAVIWAAGSHRHMATNGLLMLHAASNIVWGNAKQMRREAEILDKYDTTLRASLVESLGGDASAMPGYFDGEDHYLTYDEVAALGWLTDTATEPTYQSGEPAPAAALQKKPYAALLAEYMAANRVAARATKPAPANPIVSQTTDDEMTVENIKAALDAGTIKAEELQTLLNPAPAPAPAPAEPVTDDNGVEALRSELSSVKNALTALRAELNGGTPPAAAGDLPTKAATPDPALHNAVDFFNRKMQKWGDA